MVAFGFNVQAYAPRSVRVRAWQHCYEQTGNVLYLWKVVGACLEDFKDQVPLPLGVLKYLHWVSKQLEKAAHLEKVKQREKAKQSKKITQREKARLSAGAHGQDAALQAAYALYLISAKGQKNRFAALAMDTVNMDLAHAVEVDRERALEKFRSQFSISEEQARKRLYLGRKLLGLKPIKRPRTKRKEPLTGRK